LHRSSPETQKFTKFPIHTVTNGSIDFDVPLS
jgi:hypothetical protein